MCKQCSTIENTLKRIEANDEKQGAETFPELEKIADDIYSKWLRKNSADERGIVKCFTCDKEMFWTAAHCGHYLKRGHKYLRWDTRNTRVQGECCNKYKNGNISEYTKRLEKEQPGITDILHEEALLAYKPTRHELKAIIQEYTIKFNQLKSKL